MNDIEIRPAAQLTLLVMLAVAIAIAVATQLPELKRYLKVRSM